VSSAAKEKTNRTDEPGVTGATKASRRADEQPLSEASRAALDRMKRLTPRADPLRSLPDVPPERIPRHIAIIMDGNGRWARRRGFPRIFGHRNGAASVREVIEVCGEIGVEVVTLYSFSSENWKRPSDEVDSLMQLAVTYLDGQREALVREGVRLRVIGGRAELPSEVRQAIDRVERATADVQGPTLCLALNYGSRGEMVEAMRSLARDAEAGSIRPDQINEAAISQRLSTAGLPDPDLLIRTAGEMRLSNFLLWQISYAELYVTDVLWPDFGRDELLDAVRDFAARRRRFGGLDQGG